MEFPALVWRSVNGLLHGMCGAVAGGVYGNESNVPRLTPTTRKGKGSHGGWVTDNFALVSASVLLVGTVMLWVRRGIQRRRGVCRTGWSSKGSGSVVSANSCYVYP